MQEAEFIAKGHRITKELYEFIMRKLADGLTNTEISELTGLNRNTIKAIDLKRLQEKYTYDGINLKRPNFYVKHLGIDEFLLHSGHRYAVIFITLESGAQKARKSRQYMTL